MIKRIQDIFELDFDNSPNSDFVEQGEPIVTDEHTIRTYSKIIISEKDFELGLFDEIDIKIFEGLPNKNYIFTNEAIAIGVDEFDLIANLINNLYQFYGSNNEGNKYFSENDREAIEFGYLHRYWSENENPAMLSFDDETGLILTIWITK